MNPAVTRETFSPMEIAGRVFKRWPQPDSNSSPFPTKSCDSDDDSPTCQKSVSRSTNRALPIALGIVIPLTVALVIFLVLHRRHVRRLRNEDAEDKHKSLDFGMGDVAPPGKKSGNQSKRENMSPEMSLADTEKAPGYTRGLSMDLDINHPYLLPAELQKSKESLHSMSRVMGSRDDRYRPATIFVPHDGTDLRHGSRSRWADDASSYTESSRRIFQDGNIESRGSLLHNAQRISRSSPPTQRTSATSGSSAPPFHDAGQPDPISRNPLSPEPKIAGPTLVSPDPSRDLEPGDDSKDTPLAGLGKSNNYLGTLIQRGDRDGEASHSTQSAQEGAISHTLGETARHMEESLPPPITVESEPLKFDFPSFDEPAFGNTTSQSQVESTTKAASPQEELHFPEVKSEQEFGYDMRRLTMGIRPLPPDDPSEDPEQRANRIRSFYKEYFDEAKSGMLYGEQNSPQTDMASGHGNVFSDGFYGIPPQGRGPFAQPMARRAMTPPPGGSSGFQTPGRRGPPMSGIHSMEGGGRAYSSASARFGPDRGFAKKKLPPPLPLPVLPTPHLLKDDSLIPTDFAPPSIFRERRAGTPNSLKGGLRPYSPTIAAHLPLASSFNDLTAMPSPHALRKSGSFTALDFAPPSRLRSSTDTRSDVGSIRSHRSAMSANQLHNIRAGAYRVSRIPQELGGTKQELASSTLRPQWEMRN